VRGVPRDLPDLLGVPEVLTSARGDGEPVAGDVTSVANACVQPPNGRSSGRFIWPQVGTKGELGRSGGLVLLAEHPHAGRGFCWRSWPEGIPSPRQ
jgi:hypothetical protein